MNDYNLLIIKYKKIKKLKHQTHERQNYIEKIKKKNFIPNSLAAGVNNSST